MNEINSMTVKQAAKILEQHNSWRRGANIDMCDTRTLGIAFDVAIKELKRIERAK
jgi:hypothetical protein